MTSPLLEASDLTRNHATRPGVVAGVAGLSLRVDPGEFVVVRGPSGSGKSTLLLLLGALLRPQSGTLRIDGVDLHRLDAAGRSGFRARSVGFVFQMFHLLPYLSVRENVLTGLPPGAPRSGTEADGWIEALGLSDRRDAAPATLSTGERQRVALARALVKRPPLVLADEPTGNLDPDNAGRVLEHLERYRRAGGTVVLVTHGPEADRYATQRLRLEAGRWAGPSTLPAVDPSKP
ncbi:MAG: ABC transporter ATP-binding protein [Verrucomicrobium sp.]|nr:ABC transporter ATP-binding protein [Verrucomicrobium sp.]